LETKKPPSIFIFQLRAMALPQETKKFWFRYQETSEEICLALEEEDSVFDAKIKLASFYRHNAINKPKSIWNDDWNELVGMSDLEKFLCENMYYKVQGNVSTHSYNDIHKLILMYTKLHIPYINSFHHLVSYYDNLIQKPILIFCCSHCETPSSDWTATPITLCENKDCNKPIGNRKKAYYFPITPRIRTWYKNVIYSKLLSYPGTVSAEKITSDVYSTSLYRKQAKHKPSLVFSLTCDSFGITGNKPYSLTAVILTCLNLPPWLRYKSENQILLLLVPGPSAFPHSHLYWELILPEFRQLAEEGIIVDDAFTKQRDTTKTVIILCTNNDLRAIPKCNGQAQVPAISGACNICQLKGIRIGNKTIYPSAPSYLPPNHSLIKEYVKVMPRTFCNLAEYKPPAKQTQAFIDRCQRDPQNTYYKNYDVFRSMLPYWSTLYHNNDGAHLIVNLIKLLWGSLLNRKTYCYDLQAHRLEIEDSKRFYFLSIFDGENLIGIRTPPWVLSPDDKQRIRHIISQSYFYGPRMPDFISKWSSMKMADWLLMGGELGVELLSR